MANQATLWLVQVTEMIQTLDILPSVPFWMALLCLIGINGMLGYGVYVQRYTTLAWLMLVCTSVVAVILCKNEHPVIRMFGIIGPLFVSMKIVTACAGRKPAEAPVTFGQWLAFSVGWAGMRVHIFRTLGQPSPDRKKARSMIQFGVSRLILGLLVLGGGVHGVSGMNLPSSIEFVLISGLLLIGMSLILHFGVLAISAGFWQRLGVRTYFLFNAPLYATTLSEFWSKRWNVAFSEMTSETVYRPVRHRFGKPAGLLAAFLFSGILHEMAISLPVWDGFGGPLAYFGLHGVVILLEEWLIQRNMLFFKTGMWSRIWVYFWVLAPLPLLFHTAFLKGVVWPMGGLSYF